MAAAEVAQAAAEAVVGKVFRTRPRSRRRSPDVLASTARRRRRPAPLAAEVVARRGGRGVEAVTVPDGGRLPRPRPRARPSAGAVALNRAMEGATAEVLRRSARRRAWLPLPLLAARARAGRVDADLAVALFFGAGRVAHDRARAGRRAGLPR